MSRPLAILLSLLLALAGVVVLAPPASAATGDVAGATLQWGLKASFRNYISGPIAHGSWTTSGVTDATPFGWSGGSGSATGGVEYAGSVQFVGHDSGAGPLLDLTIANPRIVLHGDGSGRLILDVRSKALGSGEYADFPDAVFAELDFSAATDSSTDSVIAWSGVTAVLTAEGAEAFAGFYGAGTALDPLSFSWPVEQAPDPEPVVPTVTVSQTEGLESGDVVTVTGRGFGPNTEGGPLGASPPLAGRFAGVYVTFGTFLDVWKPSEGAPSSARVYDRSVTTWFVNPEDVATVGAAGGGVAIGADGSFSVDVVVTEDFAGALEDGNYGIYTYAGSGAVYAPFETYTPIAFADDPQPVVPTVTVSPAEGLESGDVVTVRGTGFGPDVDGGPLGTRPPLAGRFAGVYVTFGTFLDEWRPSEGAPSSSRVRDQSTTKWFVAPEDVATVGAAGGGVAIGEDGSFELDIVVTQDFEGALADGNYGIYTYAGSGSAYAPFETYTPVEFVTEPTTPTEPPVDPVASPGSLTWGVKASFRDYVTGPIAKGSITTAGGAGSTRGGYWFPQSTVSASGDTAGYRGSVTFTGHAGVLNLRLADPVVRVTGPGSGILSVVASGSRVDFATLALGTPSTDATGARTWTAAPATLTAAGAASFEGFYAAGTPLDPVTFTIGSENESSGRGTTVAAAKPATRTPAATPPATTGVTTSAAGFTEGEEYTFTADGFLPGETGILVVIYSEPTVLADDVTADAAGTATWTGALPRGLTGAHTLTFQGSVSRGIELDIAAAESVGCVVESAELLWGFKESFRAYIDGSIANGEWTTADGATYETPLFTWAGGAGGYDEETGDADLAFTGSVRFTGHGGVLDTTVANPRVVIDGDRATLFLDVTGTTQAGETVAATGVEFASLDLAAAEQTGGGDLVAFTGVPVTLTAAGAAAFGTYPEGEELDPVELRITVGADCAEPIAAPEEASATGAEVEPVSEVVVWPWILLAVALAAVVAVALVLVIRARRA